MTAAAASSSPAKSPILTYDQLFSNWCDQCVIPSGQRAMAISHLQRKVDDFAQKLIGDIQAGGIPPLKEGIHTFLTSKTISGTPEVLQLVKSVVKTKFGITVTTPEKPTGNNAASYSLHIDSSITAKMGSVALWEISSITFGPENPRLCLRSKFKPIPSPHSNSPLAALLWHDCIAGKNTDAEFTIDDVPVYKVHRLVLILTGFSISQNSRSSIPLPKVSKEAIEIMREYLYLGVPLDRAGGLNFQIFMDVHKLSVQFNLATLTAWSEDQLKMWLEEHSITENNFAEWLSYGLQLDNSVMICTALKYIQDTRKMSLLLDQVTKDNLAKIINYVEKGKYTELQLPLLKTSAELLNSKS